MNILLIGSEGRESVFAWKLSQSPNLDDLYILPGNAGTAQYGINVELDINNTDEVSSFISSKDIKMIIIGSEKLLEKGLYDTLRSRFPQLMIIGPSQKATLFESSKVFSKEFMKNLGIPTANFKVFSKEEEKEALAYLDVVKLPVVIKIDGLSGGDGVVITEDRDEAKSKLIEIFKGKFGSSGDKVVIEEFLYGTEYSIFVITDGISYKMLPIAKRYRRLGEKDKGLNTKGMGAISPVSFVDEELLIKTIVKIIQPTVSGIWRENIDYKGILYFELMNVDGEPYAIEYNCNIGCSESEVVFTRLKNDLVNLFRAIYVGGLNDISIDQDTRTAVSLSLTTSNYPTGSDNGQAISNIDKAENCHIFHDETSEKEGGFETNGGRILSITSLAPTKEDALKNSIKNAELISFERKYFRKDIGYNV